MSQILNHNFMDRCRRVSEEYERLQNRWSPEAQLLHIIKEVCEFEIELKKGTPETVMDEYADIGLTWLATGNYFKFTNQSINDCLRKKLDIVQKRVRKMRNA